MTINTKARKRAILVDVIPKDRDKEDAKKEMNELSRLVETYGGISIVKIIQKRGRPSAKTYVGVGKAQELAEIAKELKADIIVINGFLRSTQVNELERVTRVLTWDRVELILEIFEKHAKTAESKLQIELARLKYELPKLYGHGICMSRLGGGIGTLGPGEKFLETKRRYFNRRIHEIEKKLKHYEDVKKGQRARRKRKNFLSVALVGYTNSGKSTLLRTLTKKKHVYVADELFATLDTRIGKLWLPNTQEEVLVSDTIGFIQNLPPLLIQSFLSTLEEVKEANLLLHVIDLSDSKRDMKIKTVEEILTELKCDTKPKLYIFNKVDALNKDTLKELKDVYSEKYSDFSPLFISAENKIGLQDLIQKLESIL